MPSNVDRIENMDELTESLARLATSENGDEIHVTLKLRKVDTELTPRDLIIQMGSFFKDRSLAARENKLDRFSEMFHKIHWEHKNEDNERVFTKASVEAFNDRGYFRLIQLSSEYLRSEEDFKKLVEECSVKTTKTSKETTCSNVIQYISQLTDEFVEVLSRPTDPAVQQPTEAPNDNQEEAADEEAE